MDVHRQKLVTEDMIVNLSPVLKRLEDGVHLGHE